MSIKNLNPYLNFNGEAAQAIKLYESALGAKVEAMSRFGEIPGMEIAEENKNRIMHALLRLGEGVLMISDSLPSHAVTFGSSSNVTVHFDDVAEMPQRFDALAEGGEVTMPLHDAFWGAKFGMLKDRFGVQWMFTCDLKKA